MPRPAGAPILSGTPKEGQTLSSTAGTWLDGPSIFAYQWQRCVWDFISGYTCADIAGATSSSYAIQFADVDNVVRVVVTGTNTAGSDVQAKMSAIIEALPPQNLALPAIQGSPNPGMTLTSTDGTWAITAKVITGFTYQWRRCAPNGSACSNIMGATNQTFKASTADLGSSLRVAVTATNSGGTTEVVSPQRLIVRDTKPPNTTILKKPSARTTEHRTTFRFSSNELGSTFQCKLDGGAWKSCKSAKSYGNLRTGTHMFRVRARDKAGNVDRSPAKRTWRITG